MNRFFLLTAVLVVLLPLVVHAECGNGTCEDGENACSCPSDCGRCTGEVPDRKCSEYYCTEANICAMHTIPNCCGNNACEESGGYSEDFGNCPADCEPRSINLTVLNPAEGKKISYGEEFLLKVVADADGRSIAGIKIFAEGPFEKTQLFNDGLHEDGAFNDNVFAATKTIGKEAEAGDYNLFFSTEFRGVDGNSFLPIEVFPFIGADVVAPDEIELGNNLEISGVFSINSKPVKAKCEFSLRNEQGEVVASESFESGANGKFSLSYRTTFLDTPGNWVLSITGEDGFGNTAGFEKTVRVFEQGKTPERKIELLKSLKGTYRNGEEVEVAVRITENSEPVENARVVVFAGKNSSELVESGNGEYAGSVVFLQETFSEESFLNIRAANESGIVVIEKQFSFSLEMGRLGVEILDLEKKVFGAGEKILVKAVVTDSENSLAGDAEVYALLNNRKINLELRSAGVYSGEYVFGESDEGTVELAVVAKTALAEGEATEIVFVSGQGESINIEGALWPLFFGLLILGAAGYFVMPKYREYNSKRDRESGLKELDALEKDAQERYFRKKTINKKEYNALMDKYNGKRRELKS